MDPVGEARARLIAHAKGLSSRQVGLEDGMGWTVDQVPVASDGPPRHVWAFVSTDGTERVGAVLGRSDERAMQQIDRIRSKPA
jgi:hypothetical protein